MLPPSLLRKRIFANLHQIPQLPATISWNSMHCYQVNPYWGTLVSSCIKWSLYLYMWSEIWLTCSGMIASFNAKEVPKRIGNSAMSVSTILDEGGDDFTQLVTASHHRHAPCMVTCDNHRSSALRALWVSLWLTLNLVDDWIESGRCLNGLRLSDFAQIHIWVFYLLVADFW